MSNRIIEVRDYDPDWADHYQCASQALRDALGANALNLYHIGSTSVPGLAAKPVIDMLLEVRSLEELDQQQTLLLELGFRAKGENGIAGRRYYQRGGQVRTHHLHAFQAHDAHIARHLAFRDYLRGDKAACDAYAAIKRDAALACGNDAAVYCALKAGFMQTHEAIALERQRGR